MKPFISTNKKPKARRKEFGVNASNKIIKRYCDELWREIARERDNNKCFNCGKTEYLQVHHLISRKNIKTRHELNNAITLCSGCHLMKITSIHLSPWIIFDKLKKDRPEQYKWFLENRTEEELTRKAKSNYKKIFNTLFTIHKELFPYEVSKNYQKYVED